jgi:predicted nucleic acid-binding Zn ribbon protein
MSEVIAMDDRQKRQRGRNLAMLGVLVGIVVLLFFVTMARLGAMQ